MIQFKRGNMASKTFYRTVVRVEVLSELPFRFENLTDVHNAITTGECSGCIQIAVDNRPMDGRECAERLLAEGSDPAFFGLLPTGEDV
jgi:hypothetical protein